MGGEDQLLHVVRGLGFAPRLPTTFATAFVRMERGQKRLRFKFQRQPVAVNFRRQQLRQFVDIRAAARATCFVLADRRVGLFEQVEQSLGGVGVGRLDGQVRS